MINKIGLTEKKNSTGKSFYSFRLGKKLVEKIAPKALSINVLFSVENDRAVIRQVARAVKGSKRFAKNSTEVIWLNIPSELSLNFINKDFLWSIKDGFLEINEAKFLSKNLKAMQLDKKSPGVTKEKKSKIATAGEVISSVEKSLTVEEKIKAENKKPALKDGLVFNKQQLLALAELQAYTLENTLPCFEILVNIPGYLNEKVFNEKELKALKSIVFYMAKNTFENTDIHLVAQEIRDFLLANGQSEVQVILSFNKSNDSEVA